LAGNYGLLHRAAIIVCNLQALLKEKKKMQEIEFNSVVEGNAIPIPERYRKAIGNFVKVIVFPQDEPSSAPVVHPDWSEDFVNLCGTIDDETFVEPRDVPLADREPL
jgi:hypothetical protein